MASYGDQYSYVIAFDTQGVSEPAKATEAIRQLDKAVERVDATTEDATRTLGRARDEFGRFVKGAGQATDAAKAHAVAAGQLDTAVNGVAASGKNFGAVMGGLAPAIAQGAQLFDDLQYGTRAAAGNINLLIAAAGGFTPVAMAAGGAVQVLVTLFKDSIDPMLAAAGILDENLVKGMERAKGATDAFAEAQAKLLESLPNVTVGIKEQVNQIGELAKQLDGTQAKRLAEQAMLEETQYRTNDLRDAQQALIAAERERQRLMDAGPAADPDGTRLREARRQIDNARGRMESVESDRRQFAADRFATQVAAAGSSEEAMLRMVERMGALGQRTGNEDLENLSQAIYRLTDRFAAEEKAREEGERLDKEIARLEEEVKRQQDKAAEDQRRADEQARRKAEAEGTRREADADRAADAAARPAVEGATPGAVEALLSGQAPDQVAAGLMESLQRFGYTMSEAFELAARTVDEAEARVRQQIQAEAARNAAAFGVMAPRRTNRPFGP